MKLPCISMNSFTDFINSTKIMDGKIRNTDIDVNFISTNGKDLKYPQVYERALVRFQFMEILVRIAIDKYSKTGICSSINLSIRKLLIENDIIKWLKQFEKAQLWRDDRYWNEPNDVLLKKMLPFLKILFKYTAQINPKTKYYKNIWISAKDFRDLLNQASLISEVFGEKDSYMAFLLSMMTQIDELYQARHYQMNFYEFLEAIARTAEKVSIIPAKGKNPLAEIPDFEDKKWKSLNDKLKGLLLYLYFKLGETIKRTFQNSSDEDLIEFDSCVLGIKQAKLRLQQQKQLNNNININRRNNKKNLNSSLKKNTEQSQLSSSSSSDSDQLLEESENQEDSVEIQVQEFFLNEQIKSNSQLAQLKSKGTTKVKMNQYLNEDNPQLSKLEKLQKQFSLISVVGFLNRRKVEEIKEPIEETQEK